MKICNPDSTPLQSSQQKTIKDARMWQSKTKTLRLRLRSGRQKVSFCLEQTNAGKQTNKQTQTLLLINTTAASASRRRQMPARLLWTLWVTEATKGWMLPGKKNRLDWASCLVCSYQDFKGSFRIMCWQRQRGRNALLWAVKESSEDSV